jgi:hypothetical protein
MGQRISQADGGIKGLAQGRIPTESSYDKGHIHTTGRGIRPRPLDHSLAQVTAHHPIALAGQGNSMVPRATGGIQHVLHAVGLEKGFKKGQLVSQPPFPVHKAVIVGR